MVLGKLSVPRRPTNLDNSRARAYCAGSRCGGVVWTFLSSSIFSPFFLPLSETARYRQNMSQMSQYVGPLNPKKLTNQMQS